MTPLIVNYVLPLIPAVLIFLAAWRVVIWNEKRITGMQSSGLSVDEIIRRREIMRPWMSEYIRTLKSKFNTTDPKFIEFINDRLAGSSEQWRITPENTHDLLVANVIHNNVHIGSNTSVTLNGGGGNRIGKINAFNVDKVLVTNDSINNSVEEINHIGKDQK